MNRKLIISAFAIMALLPVIASSQTSPSLSPWAWENGVAGVRLWNASSSVRIQSLATTTPGLGLTVNASGTLQLATFASASGTPSGSGSIGYFPFWNTISNLSSTSSIFNSSGKIGIGTSSPTSALHIYRPGTTYTVTSTVANAPSFNYGDGSVYYNDGYCYQIGVFPYIDTPYGRVYASGSYADGCDNGSSDSNYTISYEWDAVDGVDGYRVVYQSNDYIPMSGSYVDMVGSSTVSLVDLGDGNVLEPSGSTTPWIAGISNSPSPIGPITFDDSALTVQGKSYLFNSDGSAMSGSLYASSSGLIMVNTSTIPNLSGTAYQIPRFNSVGSNLIDSRINQAGNNVTIGYPASSTSNGNTTIYGYDRVEFRPFAAADTAFHIYGASSSSLQVLKFEAHNYGYVGAAEMTLYPSNYVGPQQIFNNPIWTSYTSTSTIPGNTMQMDNSDNWMVLSTCHGCWPSKPNATTGIIFAPYYQQRAAITNTGMNINERLLIGSSQQPSSTQSALRVVGDATLSGSIGVGTTTTSTSKLSIVGTGTASLFETFSSSSLSKFVINKDGYVGIGLGTSTVNFPIHAVANNSPSASFVFSNTSSTDIGGLTINNFDPLYAVIKNVTTTNGIYGNRASMFYLALNTATNTSQRYWGNQSDVEVLASTTASFTGGDTTGNATFTGLQGGVSYNASSSAVTANSATGLYGYIGLNGNATISDVRGVSAAIYANGKTTSSRITNASLFYGNYTLSASTTISNSYGLFLDAIRPGTSSTYAIYSSSSAQSYLGGNLGIGTSTATSKLQLNEVTGSTIVPAIKIGGSYQAANAGHSIEFYHTDTSIPVSRIASVADASGNIGALSFWTSGSGTTSSTEKIRITGSGNVGIGTTLPTAKLDIEGLNGGILIGNESTTNGHRPGITINGYDNNNQHNLNIFADYTDSKRTAHIYTNASSSQLKIDTSAGNSPIILYPGSGNVGIGTISPSSTLHVVGDVRFTATSTHIGRAVFGTTTAPSSQVHIFGPSGTTTILRVQDTATGGAIYLGSDGTGQTHITMGSSGSIDGQGGQIQINSVNPIGLYTNSVARLTIATSTGVVTMGTTTVSSTLTIPFRSAPSLTSTGTIAINTDTDSLSYYSNGQKYINPTKYIDFTYDFSSPNNDDQVHIFFVTSTIKELRAVNKSTGDSVGFNLQWASSRNATSGASGLLFSTFQTCTSTTTPTIYTSFASSTISAGSVLRFITTSSPITSSTQFGFTFSYVENQ